MENEKFILVRRPRNYRQTGNAKISVPKCTYDQLVMWAAETGLSISELARQAVEYAAKHSTYINE